MHIQKEWRMGTFISTIFMILAGIGAYRVIEILWKVTH